VLVTGGSGTTTTLTSAEVYDPTANTWTKVVSLSTARQSHEAVLLPTGNVLLVGGNNTSSSAEFGVGTAELYNPTANTFTAAGSMVNVRQGFTLSLLGSGRVLLVGGLPNFATSRDCRSSISSSALRWHYRDRPPVGTTTGPHRGYPPEGARTAQVFD
jgi:hypothetical protein